MVVAGTNNKNQTGTAVGTGVNNTAATTTTATSSKKSSSGGSNITTTSTSSTNANNQRMLLAERFPVNTLWTLTLIDGTVVTGRIYCTDEVAQSVVVVLNAPSEGGSNGDTTSSNKNNNSSNNQTATLPETNNNTNHPAAAAQLHDVRMIHAKFIVQATLSPADSSTGASSALPPLTSKNNSSISKKQLEEREKKALRQAEERFRHINPKATPEGQACFDRLLKACNQVVWHGESIVVLNQIQVDPPYTPQACHILGSATAAAAAAAASSSSSSSPPSTTTASGKGSTGPSGGSTAAATKQRQNALEESSLDRVRKIVAAGGAPATTESLTS